MRKWLARFAAAATVTPALFHSASRAPKTVPHKSCEAARQLVCQQREQLSEQFHRRAGARTIAWGLRQYAQPHPVPFELPTSRATIHQILREAGYLPLPRRSSPNPVVLPAPMTEWELDFGELRLPDGEVFQFLMVVDRGTSRLVYLEGCWGGYNAERALAAVARLLLLQGLPQRLRFDRDVRLWGAWTRDSYPSPLVRLLRVLAVEPVVCPPRRPDLKPFVERCIQTLKYEWFARQFPTTAAEAVERLETFPHYYNDERPHQGRACQNQPPSVAFPHLPSLPRLPDTVDPDGWLAAVDQRVYRRRVNSSGTVQIDRHTYVVGTADAKQQVLAVLDAPGRCFRFVVAGRVVKTLPIRGLYQARLTFREYLRQIQLEARQIEQHRALLWAQTGVLD